MPLSQADQRTLEQTRQRLFQLTRSLTALQASLATNAPGGIPPWPTLQSHAQILSSALSSIITLLGTEDGGKINLSDLAVFPASSKFPIEQAHILPQLLRTKATPEVESSFEKASQIGSQTDQGIEEVWNWAAGEANRIARGWNWAEDDSDDMDMEETDKGKVKEEPWTGPVMSQDDVLRFMCTGITPAGMA
jgi:mediator of RNA polymerase II transcription subunit 8